MMMIGPKPFEIWRFAFVYEDQPGISKERPVIIAATDTKNNAVLIVKVTAHGPRQEFPGEVRIADWRQAGLSKPSTARCSKTMIVPPEAFQGSSKYGVLSDRDAKAIEETLYSLGKII